MTAVAITRVVDTRPETVDELLTWLPTQGLELLPWQEKVLRRYITNRRAAVDTGEEARA